MQTLPHQLHGLHASVVTSDAHFLVASVLGNEMIGFKQLIEQGVSISESAVTLGAYYLIVENLTRVH